MNDEIELIIPPVRPKNMKVWSISDDLESYVLVDADKELEDFSKFMESISGVSSENMK